MWVCIKGILLAKEGDKGSQHQQHNKRSEKDHEGGVVGSTQVDFVAHADGDLLRVSLHGLLLGLLLILERYMCRLFAEISIQVFFSVLVVHELHSYDDLAERLVFLPLYADIVCRESSATVLF